MPVKVGLQNSANDVGYHLAAERGYFHAAGLDVELVPFSNASEMVPSLATEQLQVSSAGANPATLNAVARGVRFKMVLGKGSFRPGYGFLALVIRRGVWSQGRGRSLEALRGLRIAITPPGKATTSAIPVDTALQRVGLTLDDLEVVALPFPEMVAALANGAVDGGVVQEPFVTRVVQEGTAVKLMGLDEMYPDFSLSMVCFSPGFYANRPAAKGFARAYVQAVRDYNAAVERPPGDPLRREVNALIAGFTRIPLETVEQMTPVGFSPNGGFNVQSVLDSYQWFWRGGLLAQPLSDAELQDLLGVELLDEVLNELGRVPES
jgi:NitT/TauT family transport system substrate-binding protein